MKTWIMTVTAAVAMCGVSLGANSSADNIRARMDSAEFVYDMFFAHVTRLADDATRADRAGMNSQYLRRFYQDNVQLSASEVLAVNQIASELAKQLSQYDADAAALQKQRDLEIQTAMQSGKPVPAASAAVLHLQEGRDALILRSRDRLRAALGDAEYTRLDSYLRSNKPWMLPDIPLMPDPSDTHEDLNIERCAYTSLFHSVNYFQWEAATAREHGFIKAANSLGTLMQRETGLSPEDYAVLVQTSDAYQKDIAAYSQITNDAKNTYDRTALDMLATEGRLVPTPELIAARSVQQEIRKQLNDAADAAIKRLHTDLGTEAASRLDAYVTRKTGGAR
jgi:AraC-like DNA-binding protein